MEDRRITSLRLTAFKSYRDTVVPLAPLNVLIGRNGSGKSNALDALEVLSRLARGEEVRDALDGGRRAAGPVRGGIDGCAPSGSDTFEIGATVTDAAGAPVDVDVRIQVSPTVQIVWERLSTTHKGRRVDILTTEPARVDRADLDAKVWSSRRGRNPVRTFRSSHLLTSQLPLRLEGTSSADDIALDAARTALAVLGGVFHLDPVPHLMRDYVPEQDFVLRRTAENISAAVAHLKHADQARFGDLLSVIKDLPDHEVRALTIGKGSFGDVMLALRERRGRGSVTVPARQMSDGMLRMIAIATALLTGGGGLDLEHDAAGGSQALMLVVEELENGLHPSQAARVLDLVKAASRTRGFQVLLTTHSPALLDALTGDDHQGVLLVDRDRTSGASRIRRLVDVPGYLRVMASQSLGDAVVTPDFARRLDAEPDFTDLNRLLGIA